MAQIRGLAVAIIALGLLGFIIPFVGPLFNFGMGPDPAFTVTAGRVYRHVIPGAVVVLGGILLLPRSASSRALGSILAVVGSAWLAVVPWAVDVEGASQFIRRAVYHWGTGLVLLLLAGIAIGKMMATRVLDLRERRADLAREPVEARR